MVTKTATQRVLTAEALERVMPTELKARVLLVRSARAYAQACNAYDKTLEDGGCAIQQMEALLATQEAQTILLAAARAIVL